MELLEKYEELLSVYQSQFQTVEKREGADKTLEMFYGRRLSSHLIKEIHQYFFAEAQSFGAGEFRYGCSLIEGEDFSYTTPLAWQIPFALDEMCYFYNEKKDLLAWSLFLRAFLRVLPFRDDTEEMCVIVGALLLQELGYCQWSGDSFRERWKEESQKKSLFRSAVNLDETVWIEKMIEILMD